MIDEILNQVLKDATDNASYRLADKVEAEKSVNKSMLRALIISIGFLLIIGLGVTYMLDRTNKL